MSFDTIPVRKGEEINQKEIESFLRRHINNLPDSPLTVEQFSAGRSNLTYLLKIGDWEAVLRRPPLGPVAPKAHDMEREFTILKEIHPHYQVAPKPFVYADQSIAGSPFFVMERKRGIVLDTGFPENVNVTKELGRKISELMVNALVDLHQVDYTKTKLKDMTKPEGFMERQVHGWIKRYERSKTDDIVGIERLKSWLISNIPDSSESTIIHYDFKLNNSMFNQDISRIIGVFDWEMTTVGDPLADLAAAMSYWTESNDSELLKREMGEVPITGYPGFFTRDEFMEYYSKKSGRDLTNMNVYLTFAYFKLAVICQQIYYRWKKGQTKDERFANLNVYVKNLIQYALELTHKRA
ncbi:phosphotransferase family protein [Oceanobacillus senegalensis]|uniref:phosphotransferase family protein n=1 Tax=Oceanobacillus senegalensis TaxID=1936063 RepID=UPI000A30F9D5|nr:phosphotransferase family protein [Oceanobacillus senegalensis]